MENQEKRIRVRAEGITKNFQLYKTQSEKLEAIFKGNQGEANFWALRGLSFEVEEGDMIGIVGTNGSGKSTLLNILSGVIPQTSGILQLDGSIGVVAINEGLNWELTGRENIRLKQLMMGKTNKEIDEIMPDVIEFSELGEFIDQPVKNYSSGMRSKLGFSIVTHNDPDILIVDEALSVGDRNFSTKALGKIREFIAQKKTIFFVSHDLKQVREFTNKVMWIQYGEMRAFGPTEEVADMYQQFTKELDAMSNEERDAYVAEQKHNQQMYTLDQLKDELYEDGKTKEEIREITKYKSFDGFNPLAVWFVVIVVFALMAWIIWMNR
ncbi:ATP-binding cassette domain-containing protein [Weissella confusa]|uniref:ABC transporter ATP-binding protein n=1 Tax=Weissella confusa TaxID=1583 RepID=UPI00107EF267|nr:ABC transporter ATP-binding protein [Weissella confusa]MBJ7641501.1 ATP-binding cassette domain-containing protein [Weissella confusa]MBJ7655866.1 ATP-binding cassette domain-containing protein [Weissella confusa]TGE42226.1 teichoic acid ABC transporter ATP-binding protein [Weissella confusa]